MASPLGIEWVLDWNRVLNLLVVLTPFFLAVGAGFKYLLDRSERREKERAAEQKAEREAEMREMRDTREAFYEAVHKEAQRSAAEATRMRQLYEAELDRAITLRTALAEAAQREDELREIIMELNRKIDALQEQVERLQAASSR